MFVAITPATPCAEQTSSTSAIACSVRSGAIFTSSGTVVSNAPSSVSSAALSCRPRRPGVLGELTFTAK